jgi:hexosaminidase
MHSDFVKAQYDVQPLVWDDMMRKIPEKTLLASKISESVEPVIWVYSRDFEREFPSRLWSVYARVFPRIWGASAFKGASSPTEYAPNVYERVVNNLAWQRVITSEDKYFKAVSGLVFTGWSRQAECLSTVIL